MMYKKTTLDNGLTVISHYMPERTSVSLGIWVKVGARYEAEKLNGISHFLEHLVFKGTKRHTCEELKQAIEGIGGSLNGFTTQEQTCYLAKVPAKYLSGALDVLSDMVLNANLAAEDIETERQVILEEIRMYNDLPSYAVAELLSKMLWPDDALGRSISGEIKTVAKINRGQLLAYKQSFYQPDNIVIVACGNLKHSQFLGKCKRCFCPQDKVNPVRKAKSNTYPRSRFSPVLHKQTGPKTRVQLKDTKQTHLALGFYGVSRKDPARFALGLLHVILGANMSSRLFREVREERGLAYEIGTSLKFFQDSGVFVVHAGIDNGRLSEAIKVILQELKKIKEIPLGKEELKRAKEYYIGQLLLGLESTCEYMFWLGENFVSLNKFLSPREVIQKVKEAEAGDLKRLANKILDSRSLHLALVGPLKDKNKISPIRERLVC